MINLKLFLKRKDESAMEKFFSLADNEIDTPEKRLNKIIESEKISKELEERFYRAINNYR